MNVYYAKNYVTKIVAPQGWESLGCIAEGTQGRALISARIDSDSMTIDMCLNYCASEGYGMAGLVRRFQVFNLCVLSSLSFTFLRNMGGNAIAPKTPCRTAPLLR